MKFSISASGKAQFFDDDGNPIFFPRFETKEELQEFVRFFMGNIIPAQAVCDGHTAPLDAIWDAYTAKYPIIVWKASRGFGGKSTLLGTLSMVEMLTGMKVSVLGGSSQQSRRVHEVTDDIWEYQLELPSGDLVEAPLSDLLKQSPSKMETRARNGAWMRALTASTRSARGPHPQRLNLDEVDEMDLVVFDAAMGQTMEAGTGFTPGTCISSTHQYPDKTMTEVLRRAKEKGWHVVEWCYRENLTTNDGWLLPSEIARKKMEVSNHMWEVEYELQEPSIQGRAIDTDAVEAMFDPDLYPEFPQYIEDQPGVYYEFEAPDREGSYATGTDWAAKRDFTIITTWRTDVHPWRLVAFERIQRSPWPGMIERLNMRLDKYGGVAGHDVDGVGDVPKDFFRHKVKDMWLQGALRMETFAAYIIAIEQGNLRAPRIESMYKEHLYVTVDDLYSQGQQYHTPDTFISGAVAWAQRRRGIATIPGIAYSDLTRPSRWTDFAS